MTVSCAEVLKQNPIIGLSFKLGSQWCPLAWDDYQRMIVQMEGGVISVNEILARVKCVGCEAHREPWIPPPFMISFISFLSLGVVIPEGFLLSCPLSHFP